MPQIPSSDSPDSRIKCNSPDSCACLSQTGNGTYHIKLADTIPDGLSQSEGGRPTGPACSGTPSVTIALTAFGLTGRGRRGTLQSVFAPA
ncbi:hypothetical protein KZO11_34515 [Streptomyces anulatus]|uniref:hypothetical protein n=1 Tax=Streptomyces anulatus TaxID=1892 RepID=UPI001C5D934D|nr:hypothetical protein [Streptomyces anulatus]QYA99609.1 hypothetical protein KZO11_34515 [Streptomyces anulatus]